MTATDPFSDPDDTAGVAYPPPLLFLGALTLSLVLGRATAAERGARTRRGLAFGSLAAGFGLFAASIGTLRCLGTDVRPFKPTTALATGGPYALTRNPIYVGLTLIYAGVALLARSLAALVLLPVVLGVLERTVVDKEERYLERRFGDAYRAYSKRVPRWF